MADIRLKEQRTPYLRLNGKGQRERVVFLSASAAQLLAQYLETRPAAGSPKRVFLNRRGRHITVTGIQLQLAKYCRQAGIWLTCHQLRHTFACRLIAADVPVTSVQKLLGHASLRTTQLYIRVADSQVERDYHAGISKVILRFLAEGGGTLMAIPAPVPLSRTGVRARTWRSPTATTAASQPWMPTATVRRNGHASRNQAATLLRISALLALPAILADLPVWIREPFSRYLRLKQRNWPAKTVQRRTRQLGRRLGQLLQFLLEQYGWQEWHQLSLRWIEDFIDARLCQGLAAATINWDLIHFRGLCHFLIDEAYPVPAALTRIKLLDTPRRLPRPLSAEQVQQVEGCIQAAISAAP